jgi:beta-glucosidase
VSREGDQVRVTCDVKNEGNREGTEVVQLYVANAPSVVPRPLRELRAFGRITLKPGETGTVTLAFAQQALAWYHVAARAWVLEPGRYQMQIGASCEDIRLEVPLDIVGEAPAVSPYPQHVTDAYRAFVQAPETLVQAPATLASPQASLGTAIRTQAGECIPDEVFEALLGRPIPPEPPKKPLGMASILSDFKATFMGRILFAAMMTMASRQRRQALRLPPGTERDNRLKGAWFLGRVLATNSPRSLAMTSSGKMPVHVAQGLVALANGHPFKAFRQFLFPRNP